MESVKIFHYARYSFNSAKYICWVVNFETKKKHNKQKRIDAIHLTLGGQFWKLPRRRHYDQNESSCCCCCCWWWCCSHISTQNFIKLVIALDLCAKQQLTFCFAIILLFLSCFIFLLHLRFFFGRLPFQQSTIYRIFAHVWNAIKRINTLKMCCRVFFNEQR